MLRGKWILDNILGMPPPPPPANVPALPENRPGSRRRRCASGWRSTGATRRAPRAIRAWIRRGSRWRTSTRSAAGATRGEGGRRIDASGSLPGGAPFDGVAGLRQALLARPDVFVATLTEKLLTFALGRGVDYSDAPAVRADRREAAHDDYRFSSLVLAIARAHRFR